MSKKLLAVLFVLLASVLVVGFYRGWFAMTSGRHAESNKVNVNLTVDPDRVMDDAEAVKQKTSELTNQITESASKSPEQRDEPANEPPQ